MRALGILAPRLMGKWRLCFFMASLVVSSMAAAQKITIVTVNAQGYGTTKAEALADAVVNGIAQVNGEAVASSMQMKTKDFASSDGTETSSRSIEESISRKTKGVVRSWRQLELEGSGAGDYNASVEVNVVVLQKSVQLNRIKIALVPPSGDRSEATRALNEELTNLLTSSRKFAIMDRRNEGAIANQLDRIRKGGSIEDQVRLTGEVAPDVIAVTGARITLRQWVKAVRGSDAGDHRLCQSAGKVFCEKALAPEGWQRHLESEAYCHAGKRPVACGG